MVLECTLDDLMKEVRREELVYVSPRELSSERLIVHVS